MRAWSAARFVVELPEGHRFPSRKYGLVRDEILRRGILASSSLVEPASVDRDTLLLAHDARWIDAVLEGTLSPSEERRVGLPWSRSLRERSLRSAQATLEAARDALETGLGLHLGGGTHHAFASFGEGFCVFNDVAVALRKLLQEGRIDRALVIDLDVHQGNGTAAIFADDARVFTFSMHGARNFPFRKEKSALDVELDDGCDDARYHEALVTHLEPVLDRARPDLVVYLAGADPYFDDRFGRLSLSIEGLRARDATILRSLAARRLPAAITFAGGYARKLEDVAKIHANTVELCIAHASSNEATSV